MFVQNKNFITLIKKLLLHFKEVIKFIIYNILYYCFVILTVI
jgi:hypothetical protein